MSTRATVTIRTDAERAQVARWAQNVDFGTVVTFRKKSRSSEQSAKMWAMLHEVSEQVDWYGQKLDAEDWKDVFTASLRHARVVPGIDKGTFVPLGMRTSTMTIEEMSQLIELIHAFGAQPDHPVIFKDLKEQPNPDAEDIPAPAREDAETATASEGAGAASPAPSQYAEWLLSITRMLVAATNYKGDMNVLRAQKRAAILSYPKEADCPLSVTAKAEKVFSLCEKVVNGDNTLADGLALISYELGVDQDDLSPRQRGAA